jgi:hypothetical protein
MSAMNANNGWHKFFGVPKTGGFLGIVTAIYTIGQAIPMRVCNRFLTFHRKFSWFTLWRASI